MQVGKKTEVKIESFVGYLLRINLLEINRKMLYIHNDISFAI